MSQRAHVTSIDALDAFRSSLIVYLEKATAALDDVIDDVWRTRGWLQGECRMMWESRVRKHGKRLEELQQELFSARFAAMGENPTAKQLAVARAKRELDEARDRLELVKKWTRHYDGETDPLAKQVEKLRGFMARDLKMAVAHLAELIRTLEAYSERNVLGGGINPSPSSPSREEPSASVAGGNSTTEGLKP